MKQIGRVSYEGRYVIIAVPDDWQPAHGLPRSSPDDQWFDKRADFMAAINAPIDYKPINRQPWNAPPLPEAPKTPNGPKIR